MVSSVVVPPVASDDFSSEARSSSSDVEPEKPLDDGHRLPVPSLLDGDGERLFRPVQIAVGIDPLEQVIEGVVV